MRKLLPWARLAATFAILFGVPGAFWKTGLLLILWGVTFAPWRRSDAALFLGSAAIFTVMNTVAIHRGIFEFTSPDLGVLPAWEYILWGFWVLQTHRTIGGVPAPRPGPPVWGLLILFALSFSLFRSSTAVLAASGGVLAIALLRFHAPEDLRHAGYLVLVGTVLEFPGVALGLWRYPDPPPGGVPLWYLTMWGGIGLFLRRWAAPLALRLNGGKT
ncbi:MAG: hypothetical protein IPH91_01190 [Elusimicrobia bacterium]|nr:hypothetical protein [Elusimicrobiota bacterium]